MTPTRRSFSPPTAGDGPEDESALIRAEMLRIEAMSEQPRRLAQYLDLCRRHNITTSATRSLPPETLAFIFQCIPEDCSRFQLTLRLVSTLWNAVVQCSPHLWSYITLSDKSIEEDESYLKLCLHYSRGYPLNVSINNNYKRRNPPPFYDALETELHRVRSLSVGYGTEKWLGLVPKCRQLINLRLYEAFPSDEQSLSLPDGNITRIFLALNLRELHFGSSKTSMTHVELAGVPIDFCIQFLAQCPNLIKFICHSTMPSRSKPDIPSHIELNHLSSLRWVITRYSGLDNFFPEHIKIPALKSLYWGIGGFSPKRDPRLSAFFSRLAKSLQEISFSEIGWYKDRTSNLIHHLCRDADIRTIKFLQCSRPFVLAFLTALKPAAEGASKTIALPNLTEIYVDNYSDYVDYINPPQHYLVSHMGPILVEVLEGRKTLLKKFNFAAYANHFWWGTDIWRELKKLEDGGLELTIIDNRKVVDISSRIRL